MSRRWRMYTTRTGASPVRDYLNALPLVDRAVIASEMRGVRSKGLIEARHVSGDIYEVRAWGDRQAYRILFSAEGAKGHVLLALDAFSKKTQSTPKAAIDLAQRRLRDWRSRGKP